MPDWRSVLVPEPASGAVVMFQLALCDMLLVIDDDRSNEGTTQVSQLALETLALDGACIFAHTRWKLTR